MNNVKAKYILGSYRCGGEDARDPVFAEALDQATRDPDLHTWFEQERQCDDIIRAKLNAVIPPASLKDDILATASVTTSRSFWRRHVGHSALAIAAALMMLVGGMLWVGHHSQPGLALHTFPNVASAFLQQPFNLDHKAGDLDDAQMWMATNYATETPPTPDTIRAMRHKGVGCKKFDWKGQDVLLMCFFLEDGRVAHYFVMDADALPDAQHAIEPQWAQSGKYATGTWSDGERAYVLAMAAPVDELKGIL